MFCHTELLWRRILWRTQCSVPILLCQSIPNVSSFIGTLELITFQKKCYLFLKLPTIPPLYIQFLTFYLYLNIIYFLTQTTQLRRVSVTPWPIYWLTTLWKKGGSKNLIRKCDYVCFVAAYRRKQSVHSQVT